ncbi:MAG: hypothetical protein KF681_03815 [Bdellovibrionaceae bacterium]|nr:hypothetical protein [Pseudobdellovibrionaceae bacterium]
MEQMAADGWKKCSVCKKTIGFGQTYYVCSVSTCNGQRTGYVFCSIPCFETHLPGARHRDAAAVEMTAPAKNRIIVRPETTAAVSSGAVKVSTSTGPQEVLVIASRMKDYIQARGDMNTSASVMDVLSEHLRVICNRAIDNARADGRKTVMDRDLGFLKHLK